MIPRIFHFIFGLKEQTEPFHLAHYLCLESCRRVNRPETMYFHYANEPHGPLWDAIKPHLTLCPVQRETLPLAAYDHSEEGQLIARAGWNYAHEADFIRLKVLLEYGGVYADMDTLFVAPMPDRLYGFDCVLGEEGALPDERGILRPSLCNALILAAPRAPFIAKWLTAAYGAFDGKWTTHSCQLASRLWETHPELLHVVPRRYFYRFPWTPAGMQTLFERRDPDVRDVFSVHLCSHLWWEESRTDFTGFHAGLLTGDYVRAGASTYAMLAKPFLPAQPSAA
ncbi:MAG: glycosyltransferase [Noviherbaspirillum sp.]